jgi:hypothetical protein
MLHRASAAGTEVAAARHHALRALAQHLRHRPEDEIAARAPAREGDAFARDAAVEERDLAIDVRDPDPFVVDRLDVSLVTRLGCATVVGEAMTSLWMSFVTELPLKV